jgi:hypothetical protein
MVIEQPDTDLLQMAYAFGRSCRFARILDGPIEATEDQENRDCDQRAYDPPATQSRGLRSHFGSSASGAISSTASSPDACADNNISRTMNSPQVCGGSVHKMRSPFAREP